MFEINADITFQFKIPVPKDEVVLYFRDGHNCTYWKCKLYPGFFHLTIAISNTKEDKYTSFLDYTAPLNTVRVLRRNGGQMSQKSVAIAEVGDPQIVHVGWKDVRVDGQLDFGMVFSTSKDLGRADHIRDPAVKVFQAVPVNQPELSDQAVPGNQRVMSHLMKDIKTMDMALTFGINGGARNVALWAHRAALSAQPGLAKLISKLKNVEGLSTGSAALSGIQSYHVTEYSLEAYCCLIRFLYTNKIEVQVNLEDFAIGCPPSKPFSNACKKRPNVEGLFSPSPSTDTDSDPDMGRVMTRPLMWTTTRPLTRTITRPYIRTTTVGELFQLADCYQVQDLRAYCRARIIGSMDLSNALEILFDFAYRFEDLKDVVLNFVAENLDTIYAGDNEDPFEKYKDHPEQHTLLAKALRLKFKASASTVS